jgi:hypothetical protein
MRQLLPFGIDLTRQVRSRKNAREFDAKTVHY